MFARSAAHRAVLLIAAGIPLAFFAAPASALSIGGPGLDAGGACPSAPSCAPIDYDFAVDPASATGTIDFTPLGGGLYDVDVDIDVTSLTMNDTGGAIDGVDTLVFSNLNFIVDNWTAFDLGSTITGSTVLGTVSGSYSQYLGAALVAGPTAFSVAVSFDNLNCNSSLTGQCGFEMGSTDTLGFPALHLGVGETGGGADYEFNWKFNVTVPEPTTASLLGLGLVGLAAIRRRRA